MAITELKKIAKKRCKLEAGFKSLWDCVKCFELLGYLLAAALVSLGFVVGEFETLSANVPDRTR